MQFSAQSLQQLDLTPYSPEGVSRQFFHDLTLNSSGLLTDTRSGGLRRDLTSVLRETEANTNRQPAGPQFDALRDHQTFRLNRWRQETLALPANRPAQIPLRHWNAANAITLRPEQADPRHNWKIFPPMTDMHVNYDAGGASWEQLLTWATFRQRAELPGRGDSQGTFAQPPWVNEQSEIAPVIARVVLATYYTIDFPQVALHWIPTVVLWNPYSEPIRMNPAAPWNVRVAYSTFHGDEQFQFRLLVQHPRWWLPNTARWSHIPVNPATGRRDQLWTPLMSFNFPGRHGFQMAIRDETGGTNVVIPPGEAVFFTIRDQHIELASNSEGTPNQNPIQLQLRKGMDPLGQFSAFTRANVNTMITESGINRRIANTYRDASGGYNHWHHLSPRNRNYSGFRTQHLPYAFPLDPRLLEIWDPENPEATLNNSLFEKFPPESDWNIGVNRNGLTGWNILAIGAEMGRHNEGSPTELMNVRISLRNGTGNNNILHKIYHPSQTMPNGLFTARSYDSEETTGHGLRNPVWAPVQTPSLTTAFNPSFDGFPSSGFSWGLRLPDHSYTFNETTDQGPALSAPIRWLKDFNPTDPFQNRDPASRLPSAGGWRFNRAGFRSAPMYVGGFFMGDPSLSDLSWSTPNDRNQFIGHSDQAPLGFQPGMIPRAILREFPESSEDLASIASFQNATLIPTFNSLMNSVSLRDQAESSANFGFMQPTFAIGNAHAHFIIPRDRATHSFFPLFPGNTPTESIPFMSSRRPREVWTNDGSYLAGYDASWIYNEVLWDAFFLSPDANTRLIWQAPWNDPQTPQFQTRRDFHRSAERTRIAGAFNINSTSVAAWAALLESMMGVQVRPEDGMPDSAAFSRFFDPPTGAFDPLRDDFASVPAYMGYRRLTREEIWDDNGTPDNPGDDTGLAVEIVRQVRLRGPFLSLSDFVNRALLPENNDPNDLSMRGALQAAIDAAGLNDPMGTASDSPVDNVWIRPEDNFFTMMGVRDAGEVPAFYGLFPNHIRGRRNEGASGTLMQADLLARIGAVLTARSDTFTIRTFGAVGPDNQPFARAWAEITVQRRPDFVDPANAAADRPGELSNINETFGRRFESVSFRWLNDEEI